jgi:ketosteroid isomerase-like protein
VNRKPVLVLVLLVTTVFASCAGRSPAAAVEAFYHAVDRGALDRAVSLLSEQTITMFGKDKLKAGMTEEARKIQAKGGIQELQVTDEKVTGEVASVTVLIRYGDGSEETETVKLVRERGGWRLAPSK